VEAKLREAQRTVAARSRTTGKPDDPAEGRRAGMKTVAELVAEINAAKLLCALGVDDDIDLDGSKEITTIDRDEHRWYVLGTVVFQHGDEFFGVHGPVGSKSEQQTWSDIDVECTAFEMVQVPSVTYKRKN
jgi:hypothetical protein